MKPKLLDPSRTRKVARTDGLGLFEVEFISIIKTLQVFWLHIESKVNGILLPDLRPC